MIAIAGNRPVPCMHRSHLSGGLGTWADFANEAQMTAVGDQIREMGRKAVEVKCDVRRRSLVDAAVADAVDKLGVGPDILVASAGAPSRVARGCR